MVLFFFIGVHSLVSAQVDVKGGNLTEMTVELSAIVDYFIKTKKSLVLPNDGVYDSLKARKAKILMPKDLSDVEQNPELWAQVHENILNIYGFTLVLDAGGEYYRLVPNKDTSKMSTPIIDDQGYKLDAKSQRVITRVIRLKHVVSDLVRPLYKYISQVSAPLALQDKKTIVITANESDLKFFEQMLNIFDVPNEVPYVEHYVLERAIPTQVKNHIQNFLNVQRARKKGATDASQTPFLLPDDNTGRLLVSAISEDHKTIKEFIEFFDAEVAGGKTAFKPIVIEKLKNSNAETVAKKLDQVLKSRSTKSNAKNPKEKEDIPTIVPFEELNALIISVEERETLEYVKDVIKLLDVKRNQVFIASTIVEVNHTDGFNFGATFGGGSAPSNGKFGIIAGGDTGGAGTITYDATGTTLTHGATITPNISNGISLAFPYGALDYIPLVIQAAQNFQNINVLANPSIICDDNEHAIIEITEERQFNTISTNSSTSTSSFGGFNEAGIVLDIKPTISSDSFLKLEITQNVDRFLSEPGQDQVRNKRKATTVVTIPNQTSVVIGGLTESNRRESSNQIPVLHKIPLLGHLFKSQNDSYTQNTLYFFITPEIISEFDELGALSDRLHGRMSRDTNDETRESPVFNDVLNDRTQAHEGSRKPLFKKSTKANAPVPVEEKGTIPVPQKTKGGLGQTSVIPKGVDSQGTVAAKMVSNRREDPLAMLISTFTHNRLQHWVKKGQSLALAKAVMANRGKDVGLMPNNTMAHFDLDRLDPIFFDSLRKVGAILERWPDDMAQGVVASFNLHLINELEKLPVDFDRTGYRNAKKKYTGLKNLFFKEAP